MAIRNSRLYGIGLGSLALVAFAACSSDSTDGTPSGAGSGNLAGSSAAGSAFGGASGSGQAGSATAGSSTAGSGTAGSGTAGAGAGGAGSGFTCAGTKPATASITDFADLVANPTSAGNYTFTLGTPGGTFSYQPAALTLATTGMALNVKGNVKAYDGFGVYFTACTDATAYTGVSFNIKGNVGTKGTLSFRFQTNSNTAVDTTNMKGTCVVPAGTTDSYPLCHPSTFDIPVSAGGGVVSVKFSDATLGVPVAAVTGKDLVGLEWAFAWAGATDTAYDVDVTVDDLKFTGGTPAGGAGGAGGASAGSGGANAGSGGAKAGGGGTGG